MEEREIYFKIMNYLNDNNVWVYYDKIFQVKDFYIIGDLIINTLLENIENINYEILKKIICKTASYDKEQYLAATYEEVCILLSQKIVDLKTYPVDEYHQLRNKFDEIRTKYTLVLGEIEEKIEYINSLIRIDNENPQLCGELIKKQKKLHERNAGNKSLLKDLKKIEDEYNSLDDDIQRNYVYREMLSYAKEKIERYFSDSIFMKTGDELNYELKKIALELAKDDGVTKEYKSDFSDYERSLEAWKNATKSIFKPFFMIKMRKFNDDIEAFFNINYNGEYWNNTDELLRICKEKASRLLDSDTWISMKTKNTEEYSNTLKKFIEEYHVIEFIKEQVESMYCIQNRKHILNSIIQVFESKNYIVFTNLVVVQIEGLFNDMFVDAHIQERLDGQFDLFDKDDLKSKLSKNDTKMGIEEAALYFKFYFNNIIRNKIAHGRAYFEVDELEKVSYELILDLQYVIHLLKHHSDTNQAIEYVQKTLSWLEFSFKENRKGKNVFERLLNSLNGNVIKHKIGYIGYVDPHQELFWIFNSYYEEAYRFADVIEQRNKLRDYLLSESFWLYVLNYIDRYNEQEIKLIKLKVGFKSRVKAIMGYAKMNKREILPLLIETFRKLNEIQLENE
ncbi:hypothetical protein HNQ56_003249 [Anaerotaenia torta]|uniref:hypothetical protein n=1 Tax=Anaerotaenia torta TaxID=433293 RepID=UPI003D23BA6D